MNGHSRTVLTIVITVLVLAATLAVPVSAARALTNHDLATETLTPGGPASADGFDPDFQTLSSETTLFRSEPSSAGGSATIITELPPGTPLVYLGEDAPTDDPADGERWMRFATKDGREGWLREIDVEPHRADHPAGDAPVASPEPPADLCPADSQTVVRAMGQAAQSSGSEPPFPAEETLPCGFVEVGAGVSAFADVVEGLGGSRDAEQQLEEWGWAAHVYRDYETADGSTFMTISLHCFRDSAAVAEAIPYFADVAAASLAADVIEIEELEAGLAVVTETAEGDMAIVYVGTGPYLGRVMVVSPSADPLPIAVWVARSLHAGSASCGQSSQESTGDTADGSGELVVTIDQVLVRKEPSTSAAIETELPAGTVLTVVGGPVEADDYVWWEVEGVDSDVSGWIVQDFLEPAS